MQQNTTPVQLNKVPVQQITVPVQQMAAEYGVCAALCCRISACAAEYGACAAECACATESRSATDSGASGAAESAVSAILPICQLVQSRFNWLQEGSTVVDVALRKSCTECERGRAESNGVIEDGRPPLYTTPPSPPAGHMLKAVCWAEWHPL